LPTQQRIGGDDGRNLAQPLAAKAECPHREPTPVMIAQLQTPAPWLPAQDTIFFEQIAECFSLAAVQPSYDNGEQQLQHRSVDHDGICITARTSSCLSLLDPRVRHSTIRQIVRLHQRQRTS
jgi:hypothetical protein